MIQAAIHITRRYLGKSGSQLVFEVTICWKIDPKYWYRGFSGMEKTSLLTYNKFSKFRDEYGF